MLYHVVLSEDNFEFDPVNDKLCYHEASGEFISVYDQRIKVMNVKTWESYDMEVPIQDWYYIFNWHVVH